MYLKTKTVRCVQQALLQIVICLRIIICVPIPLPIQHFYSHSFVPDALKIDYEIRNGYSLYYNVTAFRPFPGKLLMNFFIRKFNMIKGQPSRDVLKRRNLDFCKTLDIIRNITRDIDNNKISLFQDTFINSCPLTNGFYYVHNGTITRQIVSWLKDDGRYLIQFELIQIVSEVMKLLNLRFVLVIDSDEEK